MFRSRIKGDAHAERTRAKGRKAPVHGARVPRDPAHEHGSGARAGRRPSTGRTRTAPPPDASGGRTLPRVCRRRPPRGEAAAARLRPDEPRAAPPADRAVSAAAYDIDITRPKVNRIRPNEWVAPPAPDVARRLRLLPRHRRARREQQAPRRRARGGGALRPASQLRPSHEQCIPLHGRRRLAPGARRLESTAARLSPGAAPRAPPGEVRVRDPRTVLPSETGSRWPWPRCAQVASTTRTPSLGTIPRCGVAPRRATHCGAELV